MADQSIPRVVENDSRAMQFWNITCQVTALASTACKTDVQRNVQAVAVFCGMGEIWRLETAAAQALDTAARLFVAGTNSREKTSKSFDEFVMKLLDNYPFDVSGASDNDPLKKVSLKKVHWLGSSSGINTVVQARWVVQKMQAFKFETVALHVSPYHLPRAYATLLKQMLIANVRFAIIPVSVRIAPHVEIPESGATAWQSGAGEVERYVKYVDDVATQAEFEEYFAWLYDQPIMKGLALS